MNIDKSSPVMVTGATGYVAGHIIKKLLAEGLTVHATVRDPNNKDKLKYLNELDNALPGTIKYFKADLLDDGSFDKASEGCELIMHTASPFKLNIKDPQSDLVEPAVTGTKNVLQSANKSKACKRVIVTSSIASIIGDAIECEDRDSTDESHWNETSSLSHQPYSYSKVKAEKSAWEICKGQEQWDLVTINPSLVIGPGVNPFGTSESFKLIKQMGDGTFKMGAPAFHLGAVDVRDVATAHFNAGFTPKAKGRYILSAENTNMLKLASHLKNKFPTGYPFPKSILPKTVVWLAAPLVGFTRKMIKLNVGYPYNINNSKSKKELGINYTPLDKSITDFFEQMIEHKIV